MNRKIGLYVTYALLMLLPLCFSALAEGACEHYVSCLTPGECVRCGAACALEPQHNASGEYQYEGDVHWQICEDCHQPVHRDAHWASCVSDGTCASCGAPCDEEPGHVVTPIKENFHYDETTHWLLCELCKQPVGHGEHRSSCTNATECAECGASISEGTLPLHNCDYNTMGYDGANHWYVCADCDAHIAESAHWVRCTDADTCAQCGAACEGEPSHSIDWKNVVYEHDDQKHWIECPDCQGTVYEGKHWSVCTNSGTCAQCGAAYEGEPSHSIDWENVVYQHDDQTHWVECPGCHARDIEGEHWSVCTDPGVCEICGAACEGEPSHTIDWENIVYEHDDQTHWVECPGCHARDIEGEHWSVCTDPGKCKTCGAACTLEPQHNASGEYQYEGDVHWQICEDCHQPVHRDAHWASCIIDGTCAACGAPCDEEPGHVVTPIKENFHYDETTHWLLCELCKQPVGHGEHRSSCTNATECAECGASISEGTLPLHNCDYNTMGYDGANHWYVCSDCDAHVEEFAHYALCSNPGVCAQCGQPCGGEIYHDTGYERVVYESDAQKHWVICDGCGKRAQDSYHWRNCTDPAGICAVCDQSYEDSGRVLHETGEMQYNAEIHWFVCENCSERVYENQHTVQCGTPGICADCGAPCDSQPQHTADWDTCEFFSDDNRHWTTCSNCGELFGYEEHIDSCQAPGTCIICARTGVRFSDRMHDSDLEIFAYDGDTHWYPCYACDERVYENEHYVNCDNPGVCAACGQPFNGEVFHEVDWENVEYRYSAETHWVICERCGTRVTEGEHWRFCTDPMGICAECGQSFTGSDFVLHDSDYETREKDEAAHWYVCADCDERLEPSEHTWAYAGTTEPDCARVGQTRYRCADCGAVRSTAIPKTAHAFGSYETLNNGTHMVKCAAGCGETKVQNCRYTVTTIGTLTVSTCSVCGHTVTKIIQTTAPAVAPTAGAEAPSEEPAEIPVSETPVEVIAVENTTIDAVDENALPEDAAMAVFEQVVTLPEGGTLTMITVGVTVNGETVQPGGKIRISLPIEEKAPFALILIAEDGTLIEIEYEIIDGMLVFDTDIVGVFAMMPIAEDA